MQEATTPTEKVNPWRFPIRYQEMPGRQGCTNYP